MAECVPLIEILEQPAPRKLRFRYECEHRSSGAIMGVHSTTKTKTYPTIQVVGYTGKATIVVSLVTDTEPYRVHPNKIFYKDNLNRKLHVGGGAVIMDVNGMEPIELSCLSISCVRKTDIVASLEDRKKSKIDPFRKGFKHIENHKCIDLSAVRLAFELYINREQKHRIVSEPIYDRKTISDLVIHHISSESSVVTGRAKIMLFCDKVKKGDITVQFSERTEDGENVWAVIGKQELYVHHQLGILFKTPSYHNLNIDRPVITYMQLLRPSDGATSEPLPFQFYPEPRGLEAKRGKRTKISANSISLSNVSLKLEDSAKVKRHKLTNCNIKPETLPTALTQPSTEPGHQDERLSNQTAPYTQQLPQFELPPQTYQCATYVGEQEVCRRYAGESYQMYNMPATNLYPNDNRPFASMPQQNHVMNRNLNPNCNQPTFDDGAYGPIENYPMMSNYPTYMPPPQATNWRVSNFNQPTNGCFQNGNNHGAEYLTNAPMINCNENFNAHPRHGEIDADPVLRAITNYLDGPAENIEGNLSNSLTMISLGNNN